MGGTDQHVWAQHVVPLDTQVRNVVPLKAHTVVAEIAIQCHREVKTGPFVIFETCDTWLTGRTYFDTEMVYWLW